MGLREPDNRRLGKEGRKVVPAGPGIAGSGLSTPDTAVQVSEAPKLLHIGKAMHGVRLPRTGKLASTDRLARGGSLARIGETAPIVKLFWIGKLARTGRRARRTGKLARIGGPACSSGSARGGTHLQLGRGGAGLIPARPGPAAANRSGEKACAR